MMRRRRRNDAFIAARLRELPVPEHADDFFDRLRAQIAAETPAGAAGGGADVIDLSVRRAVQPHRFARAGRLATAPAVAVACFALVVGGGVFARRATDGDQSTITTVAPAAAVPTVAAASNFSDPRAARLVSVKPEPAAATAPVTGLRVKFRIWSAGSASAAPPETLEAVISPTGGYHLSRKDTAVNFDALTGSRMISRSGEKESVLLTETDTPIGPPDARGPLDPTGALSRDLGAAIRAIAAESPNEVIRTRLLDRPALKHTYDNPTGTLFKRQELTVDAVTAIPLRLVQTRADDSTFNLEVDSITEIAVTADVVAPVLPVTGITEPTASQRFKPTNMDAVLATLSYQPLAPLWAPAGFSLAGVSRADVLQPVDGQQNPAYADVVAMVFRRGFESFTVTTRRAARGSKPTEWRDPFLDGTALLDKTKTTTVATGALAGDTLHVGIYPVVWPHIWAQRGDVVVTIAGDLNREELLRVAASLEVYTSS